MAISLTSSSTTGAVKVNGQDVITTDALGNVSLRNEGTLLDATDISGLQAIGVGQTWQSVTRTVGVTYINTTGKPIFLTAFSSSGSGTTTLTVDGIAVQSNIFNNTGASMGVVIPNLSSYIFTGLSVNARELR